MITLSYPKPDTGNTMNDYFSALTDFTVLAPKLLAANNARSFGIWLEKLEAIDRRSLFRYLRLHKASIPPDRLAIAQRRYAEVI